MDSNLEKIRNLISTNFPKGWEDSYGYSKEEENIPSDQIEKFRDNISRLREEVFNYLNASLLTGEYVQNESYTEVLKIKVEGELEKIPIPSPQAERVFSELNLNFIVVINLAVKEYSKFIAWFRLKLIYKNGNHLFPEIDEHGAEKLFDQDALKHLIFFRANIHIAKLDHALDPEEKNFNTLSQYVADLARNVDLGGNKYSLFLREKCLFLLYKWIVRNKERTGLIYSIGDSYEEKENYIDLVSDLYKDWSLYIESSINLSSGADKKDIIDKYTNTNHLATNKLTLGQIHLQIQYFKDVAKNYAGLNQLRKELEARYERSKNDASKYDLFAHSVALNFAINNEFSLATESKSTIESIEALYKEILNIQSQTSIKNYFPHHKYIKYLVGLLDNQIKEKSAISNLKYQRSLIDKCNEVIKLYEENVKWCEKNYHYTFYLPYAECLLETQRVDMKSIFIASSFEIPVDKRHYLEEFDGFRKEISKIQNTVEIFENVDPEFQRLRKLKKRVQDLGKEVAKKETKSMETIALFTTIVTFLLASVTNFQFISTAYQAALFTLCLALSLGFFVFILILIRQGDFFSRARKYLVTILLIMTILVIAWGAFVIFPKNSYTNKCSSFINLG